jgi:hypothetical protein
MGEYWSLFCLLNVGITSYGLWLCGHPYLPTQRSLRKRLFGTALLVVSGLIMLATADYPVSIVDYLIWFTLTLTALFLGLAAWVGVAKRTKLVPDQGS